MIINILAALAVALGLTFLANLVTTVYLHRALTHRALTVRPPLAVAFRSVLWVTTGIRPRQWVAVHRKHHAFTDDEGDPHSPARLGWLRVQLTNVVLYRRAAGDPEVIRRYAKDLPPTRADRWFLDRALVGLGLGLVLLVLVMSVVGSFPIWVPVVAAGLHVIVYLGLSGAVNSVAHTFGDRRHENSATNLQWLALLTWGEGLHNNHHAAPTSARFSFRRGELDPGWLFIRMARTLRLVTIRHDEIKFARSAA